MKQQRKKIVKSPFDKIPKEIAVIYGGVSSEKEINTMEGERVIKLLSEKKHKVYPVKIDRSFRFIRLLSKLPKQAILCLTEDLGIQWLLDAYGIKYNGSGPLATMLSLDKILVKKILNSYDILTPKFQVITSTNKAKHFKNKFKFPFVVKPSRCGSSHGLSLAKSKKHLHRAFRKAFKDDSHILIEEFIAGTEITIVCVGKKILGIVELDKEGKLIYDYQTKLKGHIGYREPAKISPKATYEIREWIPKLVDIFNLRNLFRVDCIVKRNKVYILEINTLPFLAYGGEPYEAVRNKGKSIYNLLEEIVYDFLTYEKSRPIE